MIAKYPTAAKLETCAQCRRKIQRHQLMVTHLNGSDVSPNAYRVFWHASCVQEVLNKGAEIPAPLTSPSREPARDFSELRAEVQRDFAAGRLTR